MSIKAEPTAVDNLTYKVPIKGAEITATGAHEIPTIVIDKSLSEVLEDSKH